MRKAEYVGVVTGAGAIDTDNQRWTESAINVATMRG